MSAVVATPPPATTPPPRSAPPVDAACPLCGAPLDPRQEWCLTCGAAARTRLAAPTNWKAPILAVAAIGTLALGVLAAALVDLSGGPKTAKTVPPITTTITTTAPVFPGAIPTTTTGAATGATGAGGVVAPTTPGAVTPGTPTTITPSSTTRSPTATATTPTTTTPTTAGGSQAIEEALRKTGFLPRAKK